MLEVKRARRDNTLIEVWSKSANFKAGLVVEKFAGKKQWVDNKSIANLQSWKWEGESWTGIRYRNCFDEGQIGYYH